MGATSQCCDGFLCLEDGFRQSCVGGSEVIGCGGRLYREIGFWESRFCGNEVTVFWWLE